MAQEAGALPARVVSESMTIRAVPAGALATDWRELSLRVGVYVWVIGGALVAILLTLILPILLGRRKREPANAVLAP